MFLDWVHLMTECDQQCCRLRRRDRRREIRSEFHKVGSPARLRSSVRLVRAHYGECHGYDAAAALSHLIRIPDAPRCMECRPLCFRLDMFRPEQMEAPENKLALEEIVLLSGANNKQLIPRLALPFCRKSKPILINRRRSRKHC